MIQWKLIYYMGVSVKHTVNRNSCHTFNLLPSEISANN